MLLKLRNSTSFLSSGPGGDDDPKFRIYWLSVCPSLGLSISLSVSARPSVFHFPRCKKKSTDDCKMNQHPAIGFGLTILIFLVRKTKRGPFAILRLYDRL